jgi:hypothetical protein
MIIQGSVTWAAALQAAISTLGFGFIAYQIISIRRTLRASTHDRLYAQYLKILDAILQRPRLYPYFYLRSELPETASADRRAEVDIICEQFSALFEHADIEKGNLLDRNWEECWRPYIVERFAKSVVLSRYFQLNRAWYTVSMRSLYDHTVGREGLGSQIK